MNIATTRGQSKSLSVPNILTVARIAAIPVVVGCVYAQSVMDGPLWLRWVALAVFIAAGVTDYLDGYYARIWDQHSAFGRMLDPIADKLLVASCLLMLAADGDRIEHPAERRMLIPYSRIVAIQKIRDACSNEHGHRHPAQPQRPVHDGLRIDAADHHRDRGDPGVSEDIGQRQRVPRRPGGDDVHPPYQYRRSA